MQAGCAQAAQVATRCMGGADSGAALGGRALSWRPRAVAQLKAPGATAWVPNHQAFYKARVLHHAGPLCTTDLKPFLLHNSCKSYAALCGPREEALRSPTVWQQCNSKQLASDKLEHADGSEAEQVVHDAHHGEPVTPSCGSMAWMQDTSAGTSAEARALSLGH